MDETTQQATAKEITTHRPHLELQILSPDEPELRLPFYSEDMSLEEQAPGMFGEGTKWCVQCRGDDIVLVHPQQPPIPLQPGQSIQLEGLHLTLLDLRKPPTALLTGQEGLSWQLYQQRYQVGRRGRRLNHIELNEPTVSREHASFIPTESEGFSLLSESGSSPTVVNDTTLPPGEQIRLTSGDVIRFGNLQFRYLNHRESGSQLAVGLKTLGTFELRINGSRVAPDNLSTKTQWLLGLLGARLGQPLSVEWLIGLFWPDASTSRARKNLGVALKQIRDCLDLTDEQFAGLVNRTRSHLNLRPDCVAFHDFGDLKKLVSNGKALHSAASLGRVSTLYQGPFLPGCYEDWALQERETLHREMLACLTSSIAYFGEQKDIAGAHKALDLACRLAPSDQEPVQAFMEAALDSALPGEAITAFESLKKRLKADELEPDISLVKLYYRAQSGL